MNKRDKGIMMALTGLFITFIALAPVYWTTSNGSPDGLEKLLEQQNVQEKGSVYSPPLAGLRDYGATMPLYVLSGIVGIVIVLCIALLVGKTIKHGR